MSRGDAYNGDLAKQARMYMQDESAIIHDLLVMGRRCGKHDEVWGMLTASLEQRMTVQDAAVVIISWLYAVNKTCASRAQPTVQAIPAPRHIDLPKK